MKFLTSRSLPCPSVTGFWADEQVREKALELRKLLKLCPCVTLRIEILVQCEGNVAWQRCLVMNQTEKNWLLFVEARAGVRDAIVHKRIQCRRRTRGRIFSSIGCLRRGHLPRQRFHTQILALT